MLGGIIWYGRSPCSPSNNQTPVICWLDFEHFEYFWVVVSSEETRHSAKRKNGFGSQQWPIEFERTESDPSIIVVASNPGSIFELESEAKSCQFPPHCVENLYSTIVLLHSHFLLYLLDCLCFWWPISLCLMIVRLFGFAAHNQWLSRQQPITADSVNGEYNTNKRIIWSESFMWESD